MPTSQHFVWPLAIFGVLAIIVVAISVAIISSKFSSQVGHMSEEIVILKKRISDLEAENDYLFEGRENTMSIGTGDVIWEENGIKNKINEKIPNFCFLDFDPGPCGSRDSRWFYNENKEDCQIFTWGGCRGNDNNFLSIDQCRAACKVDLSKPIPFINTLGNILSEPTKQQMTEKFDSEKICHLAPESGPCKANIPRFYHSSGKCLKFSYGGCAGNQNNFFTENICRSKCLSSKEEENSNNSMGDPCDLPLDRGSCDQHVTRYFYNVTSSRCEEFLFGGCEGNQNNFAKKTKCINRCVKN